MLPLPVKYHVWIGEPMSFSGNPHDEDVFIEGLVDKVRSRMREMIERGLRARRSSFY